ncbi:hypothetical protein [Myxacorys almedinensis]|uniref:Uncharacterized protein n=1 Tax=Myxacorys almedinensis A TaxID=2690445 RepID=A0A8J7Z507_9CYAN|nr:hypothetical protein [Myxacorys almedinensis]NDJ19465.1 hypothetical protein [Myxacorys almedinensis A]
MSQTPHSDRISPTALLVAWGASGISNSTFLRDIAAFISQHVRSEQIATCSCCIDCT